MFDIFYYDGILYIIGTEIPSITSITLYKKSHLTQYSNHACGINHMSWNITEMAPTYEMQTDV